MSRSFNLAVFIALMFLFGSCILKTPVEAQVVGKYEWGIAKIEAYEDGCHFLFNKSSQKYLVIVVNVTKADYAKKVFFEEDLQKLVLAFGVSTIQHLQNQRFWTNDDPFLILDQKIEEGRKKQVEINQRVDF